MTPSDELDHDLLDRVRTFADDVLFPRANEVDRSGHLPVDLLDQIKDEGFYGLVGPTDLGGGGANHATAHAAIEAMAGGCLTTCFVWVQHQGAVHITANHPDNAAGPVGQRWAEPLSRGDIKAGVAFAHLLRPHVVIAADPVDPDDPSAGWMIDGIAPWVTGWGYIDLISVAARCTVDGRDDIIWALVDATASETLTARQLELSAVNASATYELQFRNHHIPADRVTLVQPFSQWRADYDLGLRGNASLALGLAERAGRLIDQAGFGRPFEAELDKARRRVDTAAPDDMPQARADLSTLTVRMTAALIAAQGGRSILADQHGQRLAREAMFLLIQGQTPQIKQGQIDGLV